MGERVQAGEGCGLDFEVHTGVGAAAATAVRIAVYVLAPSSLAGLPAIQLNSWWLS